MKHWIVLLKNKVRSRVGKSLFVVIGSTVVGSIMFTNCAEKRSIDEAVVQEEVLPLSCGAECGPTFHPEQTKVENTEGQVVDVRQTLESFMSLLEITREELSTTELNALVAEKNRRMALLPQENDIKLQSSVSLLSQATLAGEVCKIWAIKKGPTSELVNGIDLKQTPEATPVSNWSNLFLKMAQQIWGRPINEKELIVVQEFYTKSFEAASVSPNRSAMENGYNVESINLLMLSCTAILSAPEAIML